MDDTDPDAQREARKHAVNQWMLKRFDETGGWTDERLDRLSLVIGADTWTRWLFEHAETERAALPKAGGQRRETHEEGIHRLLYGPRGFYTTGGWTDERALSMRHIFGDERWREWIGAERADEIMAAARAGTLKPR